MGDNSGISLTSLIARVAMHGKKVAVDLCTLHDTLLYFMGRTYSGNILSTLKPLVWRISLDHQHLSNVSLLGMSE